MPTLEELSLLDNAELKTKARDFGITPPSRLSPAKRAALEVQIVEANGVPSPAVEEMAGSQETPFGEGENENEMPSAAKQKDVKTRLINPDDEPELYGLTNGLITKFHPHLERASILIFARKGWAAEKETGKVKWAEMKKCDDHWRAFTRADFLLTINGDLLELKAFLVKHKKIALDYALSSAKPLLGKEGEHQQDTEGNWLWRVKAPTKVHAEHVERWGFVDSELAELAQRDTENKPLFNKFEEPDE